MATPRKKPEPAPPADPFKILPLRLVLFTLPICKESKQAHCAWALMAREVCSSAPPTCCARGTLFGCGHEEGPAHHSATFYRPTPTSIFFSAKVGGLVRVRRRLRGRRPSAAECAAMGRAACQRPPGPLVLVVDPPLFEDNFVAMASPLSEIGNPTLYTAVKMPVKHQALVSLLNR